MNIKIFKCRYCGRKYKRVGVWCYRHFSKKHPNAKIKLKEVIVDV